MNQGNTTRQSNAIDIAYQQWKKEHRKEYNRFQMWTKRELKKQQDIDRMGYSLPQRKMRPNIEREGMECTLYQTYDEDHLCDLCHNTVCSYCIERLI